MITWTPVKLNLALPAHILVIIYRLVTSLAVRTVPGFYKKNVTLYLSQT